MSNFNKDVCTEHSALCSLAAFWSLIIVHEVLSDAGSLGFPVQPYTHNTVVNVVAADYNVDCSMQLDTCSFCTAQLLRVTDVMNMAVFDC